MKDISNEKFGLLTAIYRMFLVRIHNDKANAICHVFLSTVSQNNLVSQKTKSCGCLKKIPHNLRDLAGSKYGKLLVLSRNGSRPNGKGSRANWLCHCDCGKEITVCSKELLNGNTRSCGCIHSEELINRNWRGTKIIPRSYWTNILHGAKTRDIPVNITIEDIDNKFRQQERKCALTGLELHFGSRSKRLVFCKATALLDRIDSNGGYTIDNIQWVHSRIQKMKNNLSQEEFIKFCNLVSISHPSSTPAL